MYGVLVLHDARLLDAAHKVVTMQMRPRQLELLDGGMVVGTGPLALVVPLRAADEPRELRPPFGLGPLVGWERVHQHPHQLGREDVHVCLVEVLEVAQCVKPFAGHVADEATHVVVAGQQGRVFGTQAAHGLPQLTDHV